MSRQLLNNFDRYTHTNHKIVQVEQANKIVNYIYINNYSIYRTEDRSNLFDGIIQVDLSRAIYPKYFKLENFTMPETQYMCSNWRKTDPNPVPAGSLQNAPRWMIWREFDGITEQVIQIEVRPPGNYDIFSLKTKLEDIMNTNSAYGNTYTVDFSLITGRTTITRATGTATFALWFDTYQQNEDFFLGGEETMSSLIGFGLIPLPLQLSNGPIVSPHCYDLSHARFIIVEIIGTSSTIINTNQVDDESQSSFAGTFIVNTGKLPSNSIEQFTPNSDYETKVVIPDKRVFNKLNIVIKDFFYAAPINTNGIPFGLILSYEEYDLHENYN